MEASATCTTTLSSPRILASRMRRFCSDELGLASFASLEKTWRIEITLPSTARPAEPFVPFIFSFCHFVMNDFGKIHRIQLPSSDKPSSMPGMAGDQTSYGLDIRFVSTRFSAPDDLASPLALGSSPWLGMYCGAASA
ncbi:hypothetical protein ACHAW5_007833 [Stephanodiscus triporus]|uniref:Uncharacterized protein n=1 Tax=Stephanodiscus triporus TaxID=2934178 RepID=A0ABD3QD34_9STRA